MDFIRVASKDIKDKETGVTIREFYPSLQALESHDLVIRGGQFMALWDEDAGLYSRRLSHIPDIIDRAFVKMVGNQLRSGDVIKKVRNFDNQIYSKLMALIRQIGDMGPELDQKIIFADTIPTKADAATFRMPYSLSEAPCPAWDEILDKLYSPEERIKIEWAIGSIFTGAAAKQVQKFYVLFGPPGSGKSTIMNVIEMLFEGHTEAFSAYDLGKADSQFSLEPFKNNPMVAIDQDGDLSRLELNKNLNSITSHDRVIINSKGKNLFAIYPRTTLWIGSNDPVKISNRKSGLFRRLVDIQPTGELFDEQKYHQLMAAVQFELGSIARHCIQVFRELGPTYLSSYRSTDMMYRTNDIFNFVEDNRLVLSKGVTLKQAHKLYTEWCAETETRNHYKQFQFRDVLADYFKEFHHEIMVDGVRHRSYFKDLRELEKFSWKGLAPVPTREWLTLEPQKSLLDEKLASCKAQLSTGNDAHPLKQAWDKVKTKLSDLDTSEEHFVKPDTHHIVIDFDLKDENGAKSLERNLAAAAQWPLTYAEVSRGGGGLHLHYDYDGDPERLASVSPDGSFEVKVFLGGGSLRRRLTLCNDTPVAKISSGLPFKEEKVLSAKTMSSEKGLRELIGKGLRKEVHAYTKPSLDFIKKVTDDAFTQGMVYDVSDMWDDILAFAMSSSNQRQLCLEIAMAIKLKSEVGLERETVSTDKPEVDYDIECYPNLFAIGWMFHDGPDDATVTKMVNPSAAEVQEFIENTRRTGYNNRGYDAHMLYAASMGETLEQLYQRSQRIVSNDRNALFGAAYNLDHADLFDMMSEKKTLKFWQIKYGMPHKEMDIPWDQPVSEEDLLRVLEYLENDVRSTRKLKIIREGDVRARAILAEITGLQMINTNRQHTEKLVFGDVPWDTQQDLVYTDLTKQFSGYQFDKFKPGKDKSTYKGEVIGEGGLVRAKPGMYNNVALLDVASMHPTSIIELNMFGQFTPNFKALLDTRLHIKHGDLDSAGELFDGRLKPYLGNPDTAQALSDALKIVINSVYGLTAASFPNKFKDPRNIDNIVAKRGALFMVDLKEFVEQAGFEVVHIKTDSIKIPDATPEIIAQVSESGKQYGYTFEHEATYDKFCLVNDAVYIAHYGWAEKEKKIGTWEAVGAQFQHPIVFKTLFSNEEVTPRDYVETKQVTKGAMYLAREGEEFRQFVGRFGAFVPVLGGRQLLRIDGEKLSAVTGTKGFLWELDDVAMNNNLDVDTSYFQALVDDAKAQIEKYGSYQEFIA